MQLLVVENSIIMFFTNHEEADEFIRKENEKWEKWKQNERIELERKTLEKIFKRKNNL